MYIWPWIIETILFGSKALYLASFFGIIFIMVILWFAIRNADMKKYSSVKLAFINLTFLVGFVLGGDSLLQDQNVATWHECKTTPATIEYMEYKYENYPLRVCRERVNTNHDFGMWKVVN